MKDDKIKCISNKHEEPRQFFHSVTGELLDLEKIEIDSEDEIDQDYVFESESRQIDELLDVCDKDKIFFKLWNGFINCNLEWRLKQETLY